MGYLNSSIMCQLLSFALFYVVFCTISGRPRKGKLHRPGPSSATNWSPDVMGSYLNVMGVNLEGLSNISNQSQFTEVNSSMLNDSLEFASNHSDHVNEKYADDAADVLPRRAEYIALPLLVSLIVACYCAPTTRTMAN